LLTKEHDLDITAVEPNEAMIAGFRSAVPGVAIVQGTAQQLPFADASVDAVFVGQVQQCDGTAVYVLP
jgi:ubiquinone/menaquinone biosynthesis C-methylase UbiE